MTSLLIRFLFSLLLLLSGGYATSSSHRTETAVFSSSTTPPSATQHAQLNARHRQRDDALTSSSSNRKKERIELDVAEKEEEDHRKTAFKNRRASTAAFHAFFNYQRAGNLSEARNKPSPFQAYSAHSSPLKYLLFEVFRL